ncbi:MAG: PorV/PorQ family protein [Chitinophagales bacterium]
MKRMFNRLFIFSVCLVLSTNSLLAGNEDRAGEAGGYELLMNGWARSSGMYGMNSSRVEGLEAMRINVAGLAHAPNTEVVFSHSRWLFDSQVSINAAGIAQAIGKEKTNFIGLNINSVSFGDIEITTTNSPEGGLGTYSPNFLNIGLAFSRAFSESIYGGVVVRFLNQRVPDLSASGVALDAGIQYVTGKLDQIRFGVSLRNVGTPMKFGGEGLTFRGDAPSGSYNLTVSSRTQKFELPSLLHIGASYDLYADNLKNNPDLAADHRITIAFNFTSNSFGKDHVGGGLEYSYREMFQVRAGYRYEKGLTDAETRTTDFVGIAAGASVMVPFKEEGPAMGIDYSYRPSQVFGGTHSIGLRFNLGTKVPPFKKKKSKEEVFQEEG